MRRDFGESTVTPEAVQLRADVAGVGPRSIAFIVDTLIQVLVLLPILFVPLSNGIGGSFEAIAISLLLFVVVWLYYPAFEVLRKGQTPGKQTQKIRVIRTNGQPAGLAPVVVRNLIRIVDVFLLPFLALISIVVTRRGQRLGDLAAGTMVVRERALLIPPLVGTPGSAGMTASLDTSGLDERDYTVLRTFLCRRDGLDPVARQQLAARLAARVRQQVGDRAASTIVGDEELIEAAAQAYRARFASRSG